MRTFLWVLLIAWLLVLTKFVLFKLSPHYYKNYFQREYRLKTISSGWKNANLRPFSTIRLFYNARRLRSEYKYKNLGGNIIGFVPLGILFPLLFFSCRKLWTTALAVLGVSAVFETIQLLTGIGVFDVDDLMLNTAGGIIGFLVVYGSWKLVQSAGRSRADMPSG